MLEALGYDVIQLPLRARERPHRHGIPISEQVEHTLLGKIESAQRECSAPLVIVADTLVEDPDDPLRPMGKPGDRREALTMLLRLSGRNHRVWTGTALIRGSALESWLETATVSFDSLDDEMIEAALLHDIGDALSPLNHAEYAAAVLKPYVSEKTNWIVEKHGIFQLYYYAHHIGGNKNEREKYKNHKYYKDTIDFCENWDQKSFDPNFKSLALKDFEPYVQKIFSRNPYSR